MNQDHTNCRCRKDLNITEEEKRRAELFKKRMEHLHGMLKAFFMNTPFSFRKKNKQGIWYTDLKSFKNSSDAQREIFIDLANLRIVIGQFNIKGRANKRAGHTFRYPHDLWNILPTTIEEFDAIVNRWATLKLKKFLMGETL